MLVALVALSLIWTVGGWSAGAAAAQSPAPPKPVGRAAPRTMVALVFGQSNAANFGETRRVAGPNVLNLRNGVLTRARDPLRGANGQGGSVWTRLGDKVIAAGLYDRVIFVPAAIGATEIAEWVPGMPLHELILSAIRDAQKRGLTITHLLWHQGESDAFLKIGYADYQLRFRNMLRSIREQGVGAPVFVSVATRCGQYPVSEEIQGAQMNLVNHDAGIWAGPNTDDLDAGFRHDGCHFSTAGLDRAAGLWLDAIARYESTAAR